MRGLYSATAIKMVNYRQLIVDRGELAVRTGSASRSHSLYAVDASLRSP